MNKNFTPIPTLNTIKSKAATGPSAVTLAKIRQFARAYSFSNMNVPALGGIVAN